MVTTLPKDMRYEKKFKLLGLTTLVERRERGDMIQMYRSIGGQDFVGHRVSHKEKDQQICVK